VYFTLVSSKFMEIFVSLNVALVAVWSVSWMENNRQKPNESITAFVTRVQNAVAMKSREAITYKADDVKEEDKPQWTDHTDKYLAAQAVYDARAVANPWTSAEKEAIEARNLEYGHEHQEAARYECRHTMKNVITFKIVRQSLTNPLMRTEAAKVSGECTSTDIFKAKLTQIEEVNQAKPKLTSLHSRNEYINEVGDDFDGKEDSVNAVGNKKNKKKGKGKANNGHASAVDKPPTAPRSGAPGPRQSCSWCKRLWHTYEQCWTREPTLRPLHLQVKSVNNTNGHGNRQGGLRANNGNGQNQPRGNVNACS
jgi:hypothetical protein